MFIAKNSQGALINLLQLTKNEILPKNNYFCPACQQPLILKRGSLKRQHFAHRSKKNCFSFSEGETLEHLTGKELLFLADNTAQLEVPLKEISQRPDVLLPDLALEFQCSPLAVELFQQRVAGYQRIGLPQWWLLGKALKEKTIRLGGSQFCSFNQKLGCHFWHVDSQKKCLQLFYHLLVLPEKNLFQVKNFSYPQNLADTFAFTQTGHIAHSYVISVKNFQQQKFLVQRKLFHCQPEILRIQQAFYQRGSHLLELPLIYFTPSDVQHFFGDWLYFFRFLYVQTMQSQAKEAAQNYLNDLLNRFFKKRQFDLNFPLVEQKLITKVFLQESHHLFSEFPKANGALKNISQQTFTYSLPLKV